MQFCYSSFTNTFAPDTKYITGLFHLKSSSNGAHCRQFRPTGVKNIPKFCSLVNAKSCYLGLIYLKTSPLLHIRKGVHSVVCIGWQRGSTLLEGRNGKICLISSCAATTTHPPERVIFFLILFLLFKYSSLKIFAPLKLHICIDLAAICDPPADLGNKHEGEGAAQGQTKGPSKLVRNFFFSESIVVLLVDKCFWAW